MQNVTQEVVEVSPHYQTALPIVVAGQEGSALVRQLIVMAPLAIFLALAVVLAFLVQS